MKLPSKKIDGGKYRYEIAPGKWVSRVWVHMLRKMGKLPPRQIVNRTNREVT